MPGVSAGPQMRSQGGPGKGGRQGSPTGLSGAHMPSLSEPACPEHPSSTRTFWIFCGLLPSTVITVGAAVHLSLDEGQESRNAQNLRAGCDPKCPSIPLSRVLSKDSKRATERI